MHRVGKYKGGGVDKRATFVPRLEDEVAQRLCFEGPQGVLRSGVVEQIDGTKQRQQTMRSTNRKKVFDQSSEDICWSGKG